MKIISLFGLKIADITVPELFKKVEEFIEEKKPHQIAYLNAHCINRSFVDAEYRKILLEADLVYPDGMGVIFSSYFTHMPLKERINLGDFFLEFCEFCAQKKYRLYFLGGEPGVAEASALNCIKKCPGLADCIVGTHDGYFTTEEEKNIIREIKSLKPDIILVGLGVPRQEKWIKQHLEELGVPVCWGVGALFDYYSLKIKRAPKWMREIGLEWFYRLLMEPRRLWKRYIIGNIMFTLRVASLVTVDIFTVSLSWLLAYWIRVKLNRFLWPINPIVNYLYALPIIILLWLISNAWFGLYSERENAKSSLQQFFSILKTTFLALLVSLATGFLLKELSLGRSVVLIASGLNFVFLLISRKIKQIFHNKQRH